jgi:hypothetical protein
MVDRTLPLGHFICGIHQDVFGNPKYGESLPYALDLLPAAVVGGKGFALDDQQIDI